MRWATIVGALSPMVALAVTACGVPTGVPTGTGENPTPDADVAITKSSLWGGGGARGDINRLAPDSDVHFSLECLALGADPSGR
jgi:hypothetical protein